MPNYSKENLPVPQDQLQAARKTALTYVTKMTEPFVVDTLEGPMPGKAGDFFAASFDEDNKVCDVWLIDADRFSATYELVDDNPPILVQF